METWLIVLLSSLDFLGIIFFIYIVNQTYRRSLKEREDYSHVNHYKEIRDKVTVRKEVKEDNATSSAFSGLAPLISIMGVLGVGVITMNLVFSEVTESLDTTVNYLPVVTVAIFIAVILGLLMTLLSFGSSEEEKPKRRKKKMTHKEHYRNMRDNLTTRKKEVEDLEEDLEEIKEDE